MWPTMSEWNPWIHSDSNELTYIKQNSDSEEKEKEKENKIVFFSSRLVYPRKRGIATDLLQQENFLFFIMELRIPTALSLKYQTIL